MFNSYGKQISLSRFSYLAYANVVFRNSICSLYCQGDLSGILQNILRFCHFLLTDDTETKKYLFITGHSSKDLSESFNPDFIHKNSCFYILSQTKVLTIYSDTPVNMHKNLLNNNLKSNMKII